MNKPYFCQFFSQIDLKCTSMDLFKLAFLIRIKGVSIRSRYNWIFVTYFLFWYLMNLFFCLITINRAKLERAVTFMKYLASIISSIFLRKTLIWNKIMFPAPNLLKFAELVGNELMKSKKSLEKFSNFLFLSNLSLLIVKILRAY